jgi:lipoprotein-releasing system ATP-binding protein
LARFFQAAAGGGAVASEAGGGAGRGSHEAMIEVVGLRKSFGKLAVLKGITLSVGRGEIVSVVGPSGAGKTTMLQILGTLSRPDSGSVVIDGVDVSRLSDNELSAFRNSRIGFVFQFHNLLPEFTAFENVCIPGYIGGRDRREVEARAAELIEQLGLSERRDHKPAELSGGEAQRVAIARALVNSPAVLLADEPSGNLDSRNRDEINRLFVSLRDRFGQTIVIVTHDENLAAMADRKIVMTDGVIA